jgi:ataxia telangiectasia mutated family protein
VLSLGAAFTHPASGITLPKKLEVAGSDGRVHRQLLKGGYHEAGKVVDDMRQDATLMGLFRLCNSLLAGNAGAAARGLRMRCYRVVPLSPTAGVLEWVEGCCASGALLDEAHARYRPSDIGRDAARAVMAEAAEKWKECVGSKAGRAAGAPGRWWPAPPARRRRRRTL